MKLGFISGACLGIACLVSCVDVNKNLGQDYLATNQQYDIYTAEFPLENIHMEKPEDLSGISNYRFTIGAVRDDLFGLTTRSTTFTLVPIIDSLDMGKKGTQVFKRFHFSAPIDTLSYTDESEKHILQNINVYEVEEYVDLSGIYKEIKHSKNRITVGVPHYNGGDSLSFDFTKEFAEKYMQMTLADQDTITTYSKKFPGIYLSTDAPLGNGGRINMFKLPLDVSSGYIYGSFAKLDMSAEFEGKGVRDTTFYFVLGPAAFYDYADATSTSVSSYPQVAYNLTNSESKDLGGALAGEDYYFEGGTGIKPVVSASEIREKMIAEVSKHGDPSEIVISKATLTLPFVFPENYEDMQFYPTIMSPTCRITDDDGNVAFANLSDSSVSSENQGDVNRSTCVYAPDITHHAQSLIQLKNLDKVSNYDIWFLPMADEVVTSAADEESDSETSEYLQQLAYSSYYNSMYGGYGGYGGYSSYGGYGSSYSNYYYYAMMASLYSSSSSSEETQTMLDLHRFYKAKFYGPAASDKKKVPTFSFTYAVPKE